MSLILAIEPDRRQVAHLVSIVKHVQGAELILADTTEGALESIGNNVPDLILVPALLSPQDDAALAAALRVIASAAHVQMLTIPTFAAPKPAAKKGVLSAFRRKASNDAPIEGCDPKVFAEEIASYIERANEERAAAQYYEDDQDAVQPERARAKVTTPEDAFVAAFDEPEPQAAFEAVQAETADPEPAYEEPAYQEPTYHAPAYHAPDYTPVAAAEETPADVWAAPPADDEPIVEPTAHGRPIFHEVFSASEPELEPEQVFESAPLMAEDAGTAADDLPAPEMARHEFAATISHSNADEVETVAPLAAAAPEPVEPADEITDIEQAPAFEDMLANFERANLPVIEEVHAEQWMAEPIDAAHDDEVGTDGFEDEADDLDIDLSIELDAVVHAEKRTNDREPAQVLKPFEPVVPVERVEPLPLAAWQAWPRLDWTAPETAAKSARNGDSHEAADPVAVEFVQVAEFEEALQAEETLERFEPVVPVERVEPMPLAAWSRWPKIEGVAAEAYQEPIAPRKAAAKPEWVELMRSLREDIARRRAELAASEPVAAPPAQKPQRPQAAAARVKAAKPAPPVAADPANRPKRTRPIEDEWGLFDPEQCGFAALLDKLDEMTVTPPAPQPRRPSSR